MSAETELTPEQPEMEDYVYADADSVSVDLGRPLGAACPHCGSRAKHGERIGCCSGCKTLFTSNSAFDRHRRNLQCLDPAEVGLVQRTLKTDPTVMSWGWPSSDRTF